MGMALQESTCAPPTKESVKAGVGIAAVGRESHALG